MSLDAEPKNGDYVAYIEKLVNRGARSPGAIATRRSRWADAFRPAGSTQQPEAGVSWPERGGLDAGPGTAPAPAPAPLAEAARTGQAEPAADPVRDGAPRTLAQAASHRKQGLVMMAVAAVLAMVGFGRLQDFTAFEDFDDLVAAAFLLVFAFIFLRGGLALRRRGQAPQPLPPLPTTARSRAHRKPPVG